MPAIVFTGTPGALAAGAIVFEYRPYVVNAGRDDSWISAGVDQPTVTRKEITSVIPSTQYQGSVRYTVRGVLSDRLLLGPVNAGVLSTARPAHQIVTHDVEYPVTSTDTTISVTAFNGILDDARQVAFPAGAITGLVEAARHLVFYVLECIDRPLLGPDDQPLTASMFASSYIAAPSPAFAEMQDSHLVVIEQTLTPKSDGTYETVTLPGSYDGGGYGGGGGFSQQVAQ